MIGTEKQIEFANSIKKYVSNEILTALNSISIETQKEIDIAESIKKDMENNDSKFWIETFGCTNFDKAQKIFDYLDTRGSRKFTKYICVEINKNNGY